MPPEQPIEQTPSKKSAISLPAAILTGAAIIALAIGFTYAPKRAQQALPTETTADQPSSIPANVAQLRSDDYLRGSRDADVIVIEYSDSDCPFCQQFHGTMQSVMDAYDGKVAWVYRFFPLTSLHPNAYTEALALACVGELGGNDSFWNYLDRIINLTLSPDPKSNETLTTLAAGNGVDAGLFKTCMADANTTAPIDASIAEAKSIGAKGTPFSIAINQRTGEQVIIAGAYPLESVKQMIDSLLK